MTQDRREQTRCPVCQGPTKVLANGELRCRNSQCSHNFARIPCTRCGSFGAELFESKSGKIQLTCPECLHRWQLETP